MDGLLEEETERETVSRVIYCIYYYIFPFKSLQSKNEGLSDRGETDLHRYTDVFRVSNRCRFQLGGFLLEGLSHLLKKKKVQNESARSLQNVLSTIFLSPMIPCMNNGPDLGVSCH